MKQQLSDSQQRRYDMFMAEMQTVLDRHHVDLRVEWYGYDKYNVYLDFNSVFHDDGTVHRSFEIEQDRQIPLEHRSDCCISVGQQVPWEAGR